MKLPLNIAEKLLLLLNGEVVPASKLRHAVITEMIEEGIIYKPGKRKSNLHLVNKQQLILFLANSLAISDIGAYVETLKKEDLLRADLIAVTSDSKAKRIRSFKGFLVNSYQPIQATLKGEAVTVQPEGGTFIFICDFESFIPENDVIIVGIENPENFRLIDRQRHLFRHIKPLFVSRYPQNQSRDLMRWLQLLPNMYLHFGDFDFAGLNIYINEYKRHLHNKASLFLPANLEQMLIDNGNRDNFNNQRLLFDPSKIDEDNVLTLIGLIEKYKKGLEQEIFAC
jgi:hypothetical protein